MVSNWYHTQFNQSIRKESTMTEVKPHTSMEWLTWLNHHLPLLQQQYAGQYLAYNAHQLLSYGQDLGQVLEQAQSCGQPLAVYFV